ncbi:MAG: hypothetical protein JOZ39_09430 [Chloroflexi bacterium]|nr:hypothetical protein [Chloroflexota bacterium]
MKTIPSPPTGAVDLIVEIQQMLSGRRASWTPLAEYTAMRRRYWQMQAQRPRRRRAALPRSRVAA